MDRLTKNILALMLLGSYLASVNAGVINEKTKWDKSKVAVCWAVPDNFYLNGDGNEVKYLKKHNKLFINSNKFKRLIQTTVNQQFTIDRVGISFVGWENCPQEETQSKFDAILFLDEHIAFRSATGGQSNIGDSRKAYDSNRLSNLTIRIDRGLLNCNDHQEIGYFKKRLKLTILHEFGHLAGLEHEQIIKDKDYLQVQNSGLKVINGYNPISIMNYYFGDVLNKYGFHFILDREKMDADIILSEFTHTPPSIFISKDSKVKIEPVFSQGDIQSLRCLYKYTEEEKSKSCIEIDTSTWEEYWRIY